MDVYYIFHVIHIVIIFWHKYMYTIYTMCILCTLYITPDHFLYEPTKWWPEVGWGRD